MAGVQSIERAFAVLRALADTTGGVTAIAERTGLPKSTVARLLSALENEGAVEQVSTGGRYRIGEGLATIAASSQPARNLVETARPFLVDLTARTGEASGLNTYDDGWIHFIDQVGTDQDVQVRDWTGESGRAHSIPAGLVSLAHIDETELQRFIGEGLEALTPNTVTDETALRERLAQVRSAGYAWCFEEFAEGINSVAAPVLQDNNLVATIHLHGPTYRFPDPNRTHDIGLDVAATAERISELLTG